MSNDLVPLDQWAPPVATDWADSPVDPSTFGAGIGMAWPTLTIRGKTWGWRFRGVEHTYTVPNAAAGGAMMPAQFLDVVIVAAGNRISKVYYKGEFNSKERTPPTCWSADGVTPDAAASEKQSNTCGGCRHNVFGSGDNAKGKACSDNKRLAIVTVDDMGNADFGTPFMLRLPPGSFQNYTAYLSVVAGRGYHPYQVVTRMVFENTEHPKVKFIPVRPVQAEEKLNVILHQKNPRTTEMLNDKAVAAFADPDAVEPSEPDTLPDATRADASGGWGTAPPTPPAPPKEPEPKPEPKPTLTPEQQEIAQLKAALAAKEKAAEPPPPPPKTPEQLEIERLKAQLAAVEGPRKPGRPRSKPVAPPDSTVTPPGNGQAPEEPAPNAVGNAIADRIAKLANQQS